MPTRWLSYAHHLAGYELYMRDELDVAARALAESLEEGGVYAIRLLRLVEAELEVRRDGERLCTEHFECELPLRRPPGVPALLRPASEMCYDGLSDLLGFLPTRKLLVTVLSSPDVLEFTSSPFGYYVPKHDLHKICLPIVPPKHLRNLLQGLLHEYAHAAVQELSGDNQPAWLTEGLAVYVAHRLGRARDLLAEARGTRLEFASLGAIEGFFADPEKDLYSDEATQAYAESYSAVGFLLDEWGVRGLKRLLAELRRGLPFALALWAACRVWPGRFQRMWRVAAEEGRTELLAWAM